MKKTIAINSVVYATIIIIVAFLLFIAVLLMFKSGTGVGEGVFLLVAAVSLVFVGVMYRKKVKVADSDAAIVGQKLLDAIRKNASPIRTNFCFTGEVDLTMSFEIYFSGGKIEEIQGVAVRDVKFKH